MRAEGYVLTAPGRPLERKTFSLREPAPHEAIVAVEACGLCHTDLAYADGSVTPRHELPLVLGHEIVGTVARADGAQERLVGRRVVVPAVLPCGHCVFCAAGRGNACPGQQMPGNHIDGGFASFVVVPAASLVPVDDVPVGFDTRTLSVVADAVSTAYQAVRRSGLKSGDLAFVVGAGGVGAYVIQIARALGARVIACDVSAERLTLLAQHGAERALKVDPRGPKETKREAHALAREWGVPSLAHRIFECSGTPEGQALAFSLLGPAATLVQVGFTPKPVELRFSNVMAFDATIHGTWGCPPEAYAEVLRLIFGGKVVIAPFVDFAPMSLLNECLHAMAHHRLARRMIFDPRD